MTSRCPSVTGYWSRIAYYAPSCRHRLSHMLLVAEGAAFNPFLSFTRLTNIHNFPCRNTACYGNKVRPDRSAAAMPVGTAMPHMTAPPPEEQVRFLLHVQRLLAEGNFVASYKHALLLSLADVCVERGDDSGGTLRITTEELADKFISYSWR